MKNALRQSAIAIAASLTSASLAYALRDDSFNCAALVFGATFIFAFMAFAIGDGHE
jgi:hypothetical protein